MREFRIALDQGKPSEVLIIREESCGVGGR